MDDNKPCLSSIPFPWHLIANIGGLSRSFLVILACPTQHVSCINTLVRRSGGSSTDKKKGIHNKQLVLTDLPLSSDSSGSELFEVLFPGFCRKLDNHMIRPGRPVGVSAQMTITQPILSSTPGL